MKTILSSMALAAGAVVATLAADVAIAQAPPAEAWQVGPTIRGRNYSVGVQRTLDATRDGASFAMPGPTRAQGHVHAITVPVGSLEGASRITLRYRIDAAPGTRFYGQENGGPGWLSLFIQQRGDNWTAKGRYSTYRWYSPDNRIATLAPGTHTVSIGLDEDWNAVVAHKAFKNPVAFREALANAGSVGFVFGSSSGLGHGVYASAPARFTILDFRID